MAVDMFLKIQGIAGEAQDKKHKGEIDVLAWSWGCSQSGSTHMGSGSGSGKASFQDLSITKWVDKASPILMQYVASGKHINSMQLVMRKAGGDPLEYMVFDFSDIIVSSHSLGGSGGEDRLTENISFNFGAFKYKYVEQTPAGGSAATPQFGFDIAANCEI